MRQTSKVLAAISLVALGSALFGQTNPPDPVKITDTMKVDSVGNGVMTFSFQLTAIQFANWQAKYGQDQGLLRRDLTNNYLGMFDTSDWDVKIDAMNRVVTVSVKTKGAVIPKGGGMFAFPVPKQWSGGERNGSTYTYNFHDGSSNTENNIKIILPETSSHFSEDHMENGNPVIVYKVAGGGMGDLLMWAGIGFAAVGLLAIVIALAVLKPAASPARA
jgi:hypothetical protein